MNFLIVFLRNNFRSSDCLASNAHNARKGVLRSSHKCLLFIYVTFTKTGTCQNFFIDLFNIKFYEKVVRCFLSCYMQIDA